VPGWKQPGPEGLPQKPAGQVQVFPFQCSMTAGPPPDEMDPTAQALSGEVAVTAFRMPAAGLGTAVQARPSQRSIRVASACPGHKRSQPRRRDPAPQVRRIRARRCSRRPSPHHRTPVRQALPRRRPPRHPLHQLTICRLRASQLRVPPRRSQAHESTPKPWVSTVTAAGSRDCLWHLMVMEFLGGRITRSFRVNRQKSDD
jgi:hypothetical protein